MTCEVYLLWNDAWLMVPFMPYQPIELDLLSVLIYVFQNKRVVWWFKLELVIYIFYHGKWFPSKKAYRSVVLNSSWSIHKIDRPVKETLFDWISQEWSFWLLLISFLELFTCVLARMESKLLVPVWLEVKRRHCKGFRNLRPNISHSLLKVPRRVYMGRTFRVRYLLG